LTLLSGGIRCEAFTGEGSLGCGSGYLFILWREVCMATKVVRDLMERDMKAMMMSAVLGGGIEGVMTSILDLFEDLDDAITFFAQRKHGTILDLEPGQKLDRWETTVRISQRVDRDPELYAEMLRHPRYLAALIVHEVQGLPILGFLSQVKEVRIVEEEPGLHWLLLPACHRGCEALEEPKAAQSQDSCTMCGRPRGAAGNSSRSPNSLATTLDRIHATDDYVVRSLETDPSIRDLVMKDATEAFARASQTLFGGRPEELFGIHKTQPAVDTDTMLYCIRLADHSPKRTATSRAEYPAIMPGRPFAGVPDRRHREP
jgi:hypothetical protein